MVFYDKFINGFNIYEPDHTPAYEQNHAHVQHPIRNCCLNYTHKTNKWMKETDSEKSLKTPFTLTVNQNTRKQMWLKWARLHLETMAIFQIFKLSFHFTINGKYINTFLLLSKEKNA